MVSAGTVVLSRIEPTTDSIVSVTCTVQSPAAGLATSVDGRVARGLVSPGVAIAGEHYPAVASLPPMRAVGAVVVAAMVSAAGAVILGEYAMVGTTAFLAGAIFGALLAELVVSISKAPDGHLAIAAALLTEAGLVWSLYISTGHILTDAAPEAWVAIVLGASLAAFWVRSAARRGRHTPPPT